MRCLQTQDLSSASASSPSLSQPLDGGPSFGLRAQWLCLVQGPSRREAAQVGGVGGGATSILRDTLCRAVGGQLRLLHMLSTAGSLLSILKDVTCSLCLVRHTFAGVCRGAASGAGHTPPRDVTPGALLPRVPAPRQQAEGGMERGPCRQGGGRVHCHASRPRQVPGLWVGTGRWLSGSGVGCFACVLT